MNKHELTVENNELDEEDMFEIIKECTKGDVFGGDDVHDIDMDDMFDDW